MVTNPNVNVLTVVYPQGSIVIQLLFLIYINNCLFDQTTLSLFTRHGYSLMRPIYVIFMTMQNKIVKLNAGVLRRIIQMRFMSNWISCLSEDSCDLWKWLIYSWSSEITLKLLRFRRQEDMNSRPTDIVPWCLETSLSHTDFGEIQHDILRKSVISIIHISSISQE